MEQALVTVFQQMQETNATLTAMLQAQQQQIQELTAMNAARGSGVVEVRQVGKPDNLQGSRETIAKSWPTWSYTFVTWFSSQFVNGEAALEWARDLDSHPILARDVVEQATAVNWTDLGKINAQLQVALVSLCKDEALTIVRNSAKGQGLDAWRRLCREYEPTNDAANLRLLRRILQPSQVGVDRLRSSMETWEREYRHYQERTGEDLSDAAKRLTLQAMCPPELAEPLGFPCCTTYYIRFATE